MDNKTYIWNRLLDVIGNEYGVAGLMGNLQAESGLCPYRLQGDFSSGYSTSLEYTAKVDSGQISEYDFVNNGPNGGGYGLAQWTYPPRKQALYDRYKSGSYSSIGSIELACDHLIHELKTDYANVYADLILASSIRYASDSVLHNFERPADQSEEVEVLRAQLGTNIYEEMHGSSPVDPDTPSSKFKKNKFNFILFNKRRRIFHG